MSDPIACLSRYKRQPFGRLPAIPNNLIIKSKHPINGPANDDGYYCLKDDKELFDEVSNSIANENMSSIRNEIDHLVIKKDFKEVPSDMELLMILMKEIDGLRSKVTKQERLLKTQHNSIESLEKNVKHLEALLENIKTSVKANQHSEDNVKCKKLKSENSSVGFEDIVDVGKTTEHNKKNNFNFIDCSNDTNNKNNKHNNNDNNNGNANDANNNQGLLLNKEPSKLYQNKKSDTVDKMKSSIDGVEKNDSISSIHYVSVKLNSNKVNTSTSTTSINTTTATSTKSATSTKATSVTSKGTTLSNYVFDQLMASIDDLNGLVGDGQPQIQTTSTGATFKTLMPVSLTFYKNGMIQSGGVFQLYEEPDVQNFLQDIMDGFFPSQLQRQHPDGVPLQVTDRRDEIYDPNRKGHHCSNCPNNAFQVFECQPNKTENFLNKLPHIVIKNGNIIEVRDSIRSIIQDTKKQTIYMILNNKDNHNPNEICLKVRLTSGDRVYIIHVNKQDTFRFIAKLITDEISKESGKLEEVELFSAHPKQVYSDVNRTLESHGITHNTLLHARNLK